MTINKDCTKEYQCKSCIDKEYYCRKSLVLCDPVLKGKEYKTNKLPIGRFEPRIIEAIERYVYRLS